ncbi:soluble cytochrome b562 [Paraburkholderia bannensis]|uniref:Soluble cytochrome b562 n=1 Tax=Paraburkholderia bannensis TaxID=765414 RepID=A0A7W9U4A7_9BURK|nr:MULTISPECIES: cytochrome b562 [Paraburkholderia]MBB3261742.1 soluble cytochrome b562 [Paraburkholderia sp. WP4_3_2]MBB6106758.1 soluble cytochrome b562 [Paraburkholderia bannensis]
MSKTSLPLRASLFLFAALLAVSPFAQAGEIKMLMRDMKLAMQGAMASTTMPALSSYVGRLESDVEQASHQPYRDDQPTYDEGMQTLRRELAEVDQAIRSNDLTTARNALRKIDATRKHYHDLLG